jgi:hypothetical protein
MSFASRFGETGPPRGATTFCPPHTPYATCNPHRSKCKRAGGRARATNDAATTSTPFGTATTGSKPSSPSTTSGTPLGCICPSRNRRPSDGSRSTAHADTRGLRPTSLAPSATNLHAPAGAATATARQSSQRANARAASRPCVAT